MALVTAKKAGKDLNATCPKRTAYQPIVEVEDDASKDLVAAAKDGKGKAATNVSTLMFYLCHRNNQAGISRPRAASIASQLILMYENTSIKNPAVRWPTSKPHGKLANHRDSLLRRR